ncbi:helix-turn-helix domain-containing protein [Amycolatopsis silviterrae]|uniref:Helix-turn-helix domain-containing protein n=1 Tax=Amycolatopsis silviterrae TaxID=1656914 RepID=A0ABW5HGR2_9PSEU
MLEVQHLDRIEQAQAVLKPQRVEVLRRFAEPHTCTEVGAHLGQTPQRVYYHVQRLLEAGVLARVGERKARGVHEGIYQATARSYWLSPELVGTLGSRQAQDELSLGYLLNLVEEVQVDLVALAEADRAEAALPSIGISGEIRVPAEQGERFLEDLRIALEELFSRYGGTAGDAFRVAVACYPKGPSHD